MFLNVFKNVFYIKCNKFTFCLTTGESICSDSKGKLKLYGTILYCMSEYRPTDTKSAISWLVSLLNAVEAINTFQK